MANKRFDDSLREFIAEIGELDLPAFLRGVHTYLKSQSRSSRTFFSGVVRDPRVSRLLDESIAAVRRWHEDRNGDRAAFDRMKLIRSREFARSEASKLRDLVVPIQGHPRSVH
jgi:hypothetical protein